MSHRQKRESKLYYLSNEYSSHSEEKIILVLGGGMASEESVGWAEREIGLIVLQCGYMFFSNFVKGTVRYIIQ